MLFRFNLRRTPTTIKIDEYDPIITPKDKAKLKLNNADPPAINKAVRTNKVVNDVIIVLAKT